MDASNTYRLRLRSCVRIIIDIHKMTDFHWNGPLMAQFLELKDAMNDMDMKSISEQDVLRIEQATNDLLARLESTFHSEELGPVHQGIFH